MTHSAALSGIAEMLTGYSFEVGPSHAKALNATLDRAEPGTEVFLTWISGEDPMHMVEPAAKLRKAGLYPVPHIGARHLESSAQLEQLSARLAGDGGVDRILVIGGDRAKPAGPYSSSLEVMQSGAFQKAGITRMAVAGFPEGNPNISQTTLDEALAAKLDFARGNGLQLSIVTQFCFAAEPIAAWLKRIRAQHIDVPVRIGLAGPASIVTLARYAVHCGVGKSLHVLTDHPSFAKLVTEKGPEPIVRGIANLAAPGENLSLPPGVAGLHFFVFGGVNKTLDWIKDARTR
jgi:methylenetetrahydrofolate reductase (NADPH)